MLKSNRKSILTIISVALIISFTILPADTYAASTNKKMTAYDEVCKVKNNVYCTCDAGIYKVNLKTSKVTRLIKNDPYTTGKYYGWMKYYKGYLYYNKSNEDTCLGIYRIKPTTKKIKTISTEEEITSYAISGKKIYTEVADDSLGKIYGRVMSLTGKNKKTTTVMPKMKTKRSNASGYKLVTKWNVNGSSISKYYLQKPNGKRIYLGKAKM